MRIGRNKTGAAGHIKKNTQGTSNEISFSVLDSMKGPDEEDDGTSPLGRISLFTLGPKRPAGTPSKEPSLPGTSSAGKRSNGRSKPRGTSWKPPAGEVKERRKHRKRSKRLAIAFVGALCTVGLAFGGIVAVGRYQQMQERAQTLDGQIESVREQYSVAEPFLTLVESTLQTPLAEVDAAALDAQVVDWDARQQSVATKLRATKTSLEHLEEQLTGTDAERANSAIAVVNATTKAMEAGRGALAEVLDAAKANAQAQAFTENAVAGDSDARAAAAIPLSDTSSTEAAISQSNAAIADFAAARDAVQALASNAAALIEGSGAFTESAADLLKPFADYANLRIQAQECAIQADEGYLNQSSQQIAEANARYNELEQQAAELITEQRGRYPADILQRAYEEALPQSENVTSWQTEWGRAKQELSRL